MDLQMIGDLLRMVRRRLWIIIAVVGVGIAATVLYALTKPSVYEAQAKILVEAQLIPTDAAGAAAGDQSTARRLQLIQERLMARDNLVAVIQKLNLYAGTPLSLNEKAEMLRQSVRMDSISVQNQGWGSQDNGIVAFTITGRFGDRKAVAAIVDEFVDSAIASNIRVRAERARDTLTYYQKEEEQLAGAIAALETETAAFKKANEDALPDSLTSRRAELSRLQESDLEIDRRIIDLEEEQGGIQMELAAPDALLPSARTPEQTELRALELELAQRKGVLAANHPELKRLRDKIAAVRALIPEEASEDGTGTAAEDRRVAMKRQVSLLGRQIEQLQAQKATLAERRTALEGSIRRTPEVESTLAGMNRRLVDLQDQHSGAAVRLAEARTGEQLEANRQSERFEVVENALVPETPVEPNRMKLLIMGLGASLGLAGGLAFLLEMLNPVIRTSGQMQRQLDIRPVIAIPYVMTPGQRRRQVVKRLAAVAVFLVLATAIGVPLYHRYGEGIVEKIGARPMEAAQG